jgi:hypothetical protein
VEIALAQATAHVNKVWVAVCDRAGPERGVEWTGASCIVDPTDGWRPARCATTVRLRPRATATSLPGTRRGASETTCAATCGRSSTRPRGPRATPRGSPPRASAARAGRPPRPLPEPPVANRHASQREHERVGLHDRLELGGEDVGEVGAPAAPRGQLEVVPDLDSGPVEARGIEIALVGVQGLAEGGRSDGERDLVAARRQEALPRRAPRRLRPSRRPRSVSRRAGYRAERPMRSRTL